MQDLDFLLEEAKKQLKMTEKKLVELHKLVLKKLQNLSGFHAQVEL